MFQAVVDKHKADRNELSLQADHLEKSATAAADKFSSLIVDDLNEEVKQIYDTQKVLERESRLLKQELAALTLQLTTWSSKAQELLETLKHVGDLEHYISVLDQEAAAVAKVLTAAVASKQAPESASGRVPEQLSVDTTSLSSAAGDSENKAYTNTTPAGPLSPATVAAAASGDDILSSPKQRNSVVASSSSSKASPGSAAIAKAEPWSEAECAEAAAPAAVAGDSQPSLAQLPVSSRASR